MGVAGCGKSTLGRVVADHCGLPLLEGDDFHSDANRQKMARGEALTDADRTGWLAALCEQLRAHTRGVVLTCSALKRAYREQLRLAAPGLRFVFLEISENDAQARVSSRAGGHFFVASLVGSQFATLQSPAGEPGVLTVDAMAPLPHLQAQVSAWLTHRETA